MSFHLQEETTLGNLITDAMVWANRNRKTEKGESFLMAIHHSGGMRLLVVANKLYLELSLPRTTLDAGNVTLGGLMNVLPFEHSFDRAEVKGKIIREIFERSASQWKEANGQFLQV